MREARRAERASQAAARSRYFIEAIERGLDILSLFGPESPSLSLAEIARQSGSIPSTALRLIMTLVDLDFLEELPESGRYRPSLAALKVGHAALATSALRALARPVLERVHRASGECVTLGVPIGRDILLVDSLASSDALAIRIQPGSRFPAHCTAVGKAILAASGSGAAAAALAGRAVEKLGPRTIVSVRELEAALAAARKNGFAIQDEELAAGMRSVAAPVIGVGGTADAGIGIVLAAARGGVDVLRRELAPLVIGAAAELSAKLRAQG
jgi:IclR family pca regulon transcriptional regulator